MLVRIGAWSYRRRWTVLVSWLVLLVAMWAGSNIVGSAFSDELDIPDSETKRGFDVLDEHFAGVGSGLTGSIVFTAEQGVESPEVRAAMEQVFAAADELEGVTVTSPYSPPGATQVNGEGDVAFARVDLDADIGETEAGEIGAELRELKPDVDGLEVLIGGQALSEFKPPESELIGIAFAIVILVVAFGSVVAMGIPIGVALIGVGTGLGAATLLSNVITIPQFALTIGAMIGIGVGIDYALFIVTRFRETLHTGHSTVESTGRAMDTAGRAVVFAGMTVVISLLGLVVIGLSFVTGLAVSAAATVLFTMLASVTLLPALLGFAGERVETTRWRGAIAAGFVAVALFGVGAGIQPLVIGLPIALVVLVAGSFVPSLRRRVHTPDPKPLRETGWYRFSRVIQARPWTAAIGGSLVLVLLSLPIVGLRLGFSDEGNAPEGSDHREAYDLLSDGFGPGFNGPFIVAVEVSDPADLSVVGALAIALREADGVAAVNGPLPDDAGDPEAAVIQVYPQTAPQDERTEQLLDQLRADVIPSALEGTEVDAHITGFAAASSDFTDYLSSRTLVFYAVVLLMSFLFLMVVFRSLLVPLKAVIMNMLSISAAYGATVAAFQWGWADGLFDTGRGAPIEPFIPMMMFAVVFGLSMDYEVFLLSRIKEEYDRNGDAVRSVADGLAATARVITAAAAIMVVVFGSFVFEVDRVVRLFGFGLAVAVLLDATLVRMILVPATMELLGERNWWIPRWLDRILPRINIEGRPDDDMPPELGGGDTAIGADHDPDADPDREPVPVG